MEKKELWRLREHLALKEGRASLVIAANPRARLGRPPVSDEESVKFSQFGEVSLCRMATIRTEMIFTALEQNDIVSAKEQTNSLLKSLNTRMDIIRLLQKRDEAA